MKKDPEKILPKRLNTTKIITSLIIISTIGSILIVVSLVFFAPTQEGFSELSLLMYDNELETYKYEGYPINVFRTVNRTVFFMVKNFEDKVTYYQLQVKATKLSQNTSTVSPLSTSKSQLMYTNNTFEKILSPATKGEKENNNQFNGHYIWEPTNITLFLNPQIEAVLEGETGMKIVFELWKYNTKIARFAYTGVFTFLELDVFYW
jgi:hypothetical protein